MRRQIPFYPFQQRIAGQQVEEVVSMEPAYVLTNPALLMASDFMRIVLGN